MGHGREKAMRAYQKHKVESADDGGAQAREWRKMPHRKKRQTQSAERERREIEAQTRVRTVNGEKATR